MPLSFAQAGWFFVFKPEAWQQFAGGRAAHHRKAVYRPHDPGRGRSNFRFCESAGTPAEVPNSFRVLPVVALRLPPANGYQASGLNAE